MHRSAALLNRFLLMPLKNYNSDFEVCVPEDADDGVLDAINGGWLEKKERKALDAHFDGGDVIELGAGLGIITSHVAKMTDGDVYSYEADPKTAECARKTLEANDIENAEVVSTAYHPSDSAAHLEREDDLFLSHLVSDGGLATESVEVPSTSLNAIIEKHDLTNVTLICDIEGAEHLLLKDEMDVVTDHVDIAFFEFHEGELSLPSEDSTPQTHINLLRDGGFIWANHSTSVPVFRKVGVKSESDVFRHLVVELLGKYVEPSTARDAYERLVEWSGDEELLVKLVNADEEAIANQVEPIRLYNQKSKYVKNLAKMVYDDFGSVDGLHQYLETASCDDVRQKLRSVKGIGPKTVEVMAVLTQR